MTMETLLLVQMANKNIDVVFVLEAELIKTTPRALRAIQTK